MPTPGERIRTAREKLGLTQAELGGEFFSASYISHLEHDRRSPTPEVVEHLTRRLGLTEVDLQRTAPSISQDQFAATVAMHVSALESALEGDLRSRHPIERRSQAPQQDDWVSMYLAAEALRQQGHYEQLADSARALVQHPLTQMSASLRTAAMALHAISLRAIGDLAGSLEVAREAVEAADESGDPSNRARAELVLIPALSELGLAPETQTHVDVLIDLLESVPSVPLRGRMAATAGNARFMLGDIESGLELHDMASQWIRPDGDLRLWARFCKASARMRIGAGITSGVEDLLRDAARGLELVGNHSDLRELDLTRGEYLLLTGDPEGAVESVEKALADESLPPQTRAAAHEALARAADQTGDRTSAREHWTMAARLHDEQGALDKAVLIWRALAQQA